ncbi:prolyl 4-hydroxylase [Sphingomonas endophytica]|uniref:Prolyl 4-hydroxylase n=1 Tax=Sphingomonas endophytica TaxID=869719 RepID=A0A7X0JEW7_9SPHN|nr:2OG-Fe(II) oxygenase [Sphingomonas endophytica]MBB6505271.1 prolyl 4-hydroxylase [Sphingomonas endophytica]
MADGRATRAEQLAAAGQIDAAVTLLVEGAASGDAGAAMLLAVWHLRGTPVPRDLPRARALLRRAVQIGHVDAALMEVALTANGSGGAPDWPAALALLRTAAQGDAVAAAQLALVAAMALDGGGGPSSLSPGVPLATIPRIVHFSGFLTAAECAHVASVAGAMLEPARIIDPATGQWVAHPIRTSDAAAIGPVHEDLVMRAINARIAAASGTAIEQGEALTVLRYRPGQEYRPHLDTIHGAANQRVATMLIYLNGGFAGGETHFPAPRVTVTPRGGDALLFFNTLADDRADPATRHAGLPVRSGAKWLATRWIRARPLDPWNQPADAL